MLRNEFHRCVRGNYLFFFFFRIENAAFGYEADPNLLVFLFSSNSFYSHLSCTVLLLFFFFFSHTLLNNFYIYNGKEDREMVRRKKAMQRPFLSCPSEVF